ncbi:CLC_0170 family protein [Selenihalanaerobacter shriftii]|uniref:Uncharacterized protein n=1 Tax=Selenihalanaerobacter shriftii TaxID=142842 RepID=A0A1T4JUS1_9FIRM|nr:CLC_0170 family protein [Selenihalanaerobacter shriftii]SJZ33884.1 hypothetical protein SAMN02745118_00426 [Selenihalanaerobacter shriftii]
MSVVSNYLKFFVEYLVSVYTPLPAVLVVSIGAYSAFYETHNLDEDDLEREKRFAQVVGWLYMVGGAALYIGLKFYTWFS